MKILYLIFVLVGIVGVDAFSCKYSTRTISKLYPTSFSKQPPSCVLGSLKLPLGAALRSTHRTSIRMVGNKDGVDDFQPDEFKAELMVEKIENTIDNLVQKEKFHEAAALRDKLGRLQIDDTTSVLRVNSEFYTAFSKKDLDKMGTLWYKGSAIQCVHPGQKPLMGYDEIMGMWRNMFQAKDKAFKGTEIRADNVRVCVRGTSAHVLCTEVVSSRGASRRMTATNIFRKYAGHWYLVHHHASQAGARMMGGGGGGGGDMTAEDVLAATNEQGVGVVEDIVSAIQEAMGQGALDQDYGRGASDSLDKPMGFQFKTGDGSGIVGRMVIVDQDDGAGGSGYSSQGLRYSRGRLNGEDDDDDEDEDDEDEDEDEEAVPRERPLMEGTTDLAVEALRRLTRDGRLSRDQKRKLLTSIVGHHKEGGAASEVEIAYELLVLRFLPRNGGGGSDEAELLDDFADQCRALADQMP